MINTNQHNITIITFVFLVSTFSGRVRPTESFHPHHRHAGFQSMLLPTLYRHLSTSYFQYQEGHRRGHVSSRDNGLATTSTPQQENFPSIGDKDEGISVGIDLGTTRSCIAMICGNNVPTIITIPQNGRTMPSVVCFVPNHDVPHNDHSSPSQWSSSSLSSTTLHTVLVGQEACNAENQWGAYRNVKRIIGSGGKISPNIRNAVPFIIPSTQGRTFRKDNLLNRIHDAMEYPTLLQLSYSPLHPSVRPEIISAHILQSLRRAAEWATGQNVTRAVIGVPAYFHDAQREATKRAAEWAGLGKVKLLREPEAAALAYGIGKEQLGMGNQDELVLVFDLGGGTFDVSMLLVGGGVTEIISTSGNAELGGSDMDNRVAEHLRELLRIHCGLTRTTVWSQAANNAILRAAEQIRINLSNYRRINLALPASGDTWNCSIRTGQEVLLPLDYSFHDSDLNETGTWNGTHILCSLSRRTLERLCKDELQGLLRPIREVAIMSGALLPGDANPTMVDAAFEQQEEYDKWLQNDAIFQNFYSDDPLNVDDETETDRESLLLPGGVESVDIKTAKQAQQKGRQRSRRLAREERKFRQEKRKVEEREMRKISQSSAPERIKIRDGISGRPISRVVLVGGATRMPAIGRLIAALTGVVPQRTVNPDEAVALGCAVHAGILDGVEGMGKVINPMQAAILKALAEQRGMMSRDTDDDEEYDEVEYY